METITIVLNKLTACILAFFACTGLIANLSFIIILFFIVKKGGVFEVGFIQDKEDDRGESD